MARHRRKIRNPLFRKRWFADETIIQCVNWYLRFKLSYRDLAQIMCRSRKLDLNAFSGKIVRVKIKHTRRSRGKLMVREKVARL